MAADESNRLALVLNELTVNTVQHALPGREAGSLTITVSLPAPQLLEIELRDDGPGYPPDVLDGKRSGLGLELAKNIVERSLEGEMELRNENGAVTVIRFKVET
jgi:two-component sensor histidine kinase